jgi:hypothetical protein
MGIIHAFNCHYKKQLIWKTNHDRGRLLQVATHAKLDVLSAMLFRAEACRLITPATNEKCFLKCGISNDHVSSNDDSAVKLNEDQVDN